MAGAWGWAFSSVLGLCKAIVVSLVGGVLFGPGVFVAYPYLVQMRKDEEARQVRAEELLVDEKL
ncbi:hypothetical protein DL93DRAFT_2071138 [Clavulina sp. PMI_390]|nr:hypothetical protein DL93DRAFT_2071138 [Clavulina sp. PMI_390]